MTKDPHITVVFSFITWCSWLWQSFFWSNFLGLDAMLWSSQGIITAVYYFSGLAQQIFAIKEYFSNFLRLFLQISLSLSHNLYLFNLFIFNWCHFFTFFSFLYYISSFKDNIFKIFGFSFFSFSCSFY